MQTTRTSSTLLLIVGIAAASCGSPERAPVSTLSRDSAGVRIVENATTSAACVLEPTPDLDLGMADGPPEHQFQAIGDAATLSDGRVAVVDRGSQDVRVFFPDGALDLAFGGEGGGPGEFRYLSSLWVLPEDTLLIADQRPLRFSWFTASGDFVRSVLIEPPYGNPPQAIGLLSGSAYLIAQDCCARYGAPWEWAERTLTVFRHAATGTLLDTLIVLPFGRWALFDAELAIAGRPVFEAVSHVSARDTRVVIGRAKRPEIEVFDVADMERPRSLVRWTGPDRTVREEDVAAYRAWELGQPARVGLENDSWYRRSAEVLASTDRLVAKRLPAHGDVRITRDGALWVQDYPRRRDQPQEWMVFEPSGEFRCRLPVPYAESWDLYEAGPDHVLGMERDELDVEHVRRYRFSGPLPAPG